MIKIGARVIIMADFDGDEVIPEERGEVKAMQGDWVKIRVDRRYRDHRFFRDDGTRLVKWQQISEEE